MVKLLCCCLIGLSANALAQDLDAGVPDEVRPSTLEPVSPPSHVSPALPVTGVAPAPSTALATLQSILAAWPTHFYGFVEFDSVADSTQSFNEPAGNGAVARQDTLAGKNGRLMFGVRNSRFGFKLGAPQFGPIKASAVLEMDFLGNQPSPISEAAFFSNPAFRIRHFAIKLETPAVDVLVGQSWQLFGWQPYFDPNTVEIQGIAGEVFSRAPQLRLSRTFHSDPVNVEVALAASRPPERDSFLPDGQAGVRLLVNQWKGLRTIGSAGTSVDPAGFGVSGVVRQFSVPEFTGSPKNLVSTTGWGVSLDAMVPIVPATLEDRANALTLIASFVRGDGIADLYAGLTGGVVNPSVPNPSGSSPAPTYTSILDPGLVVFDAGGVPHAVAWQTFIVGLQYYLPPTGNVWLAINFSESNSVNAKLFGPPAKVFTRSYWADLNMFIDLTPSVRLGAEYALTQQTYADQASATNHRVQVSAFYLF